MAKSLIKSWKKLVPESSDKKEKEKEKKEEKKEEKEKPAPKSSFTPNSFSGTGTGTSFSFAHDRTAIKMFGITCCNFLCAGKVATNYTGTRIALWYFSGTVCHLYFFSYHIAVYEYAVVPATSFMNGR